MKDGHFYPEAGFGWDKRIQYFLFQIPGSIFHFKELTIPETKKYLASKGIPVRV